MKSFSLLSVFLLFLGCISVTTTHVQHADGSADITQETDMSVLTSYAESYNEYEANVSGIEGQCDEIREMDPEILCSYEDGVITVSKHYTPENSFYKFEVKNEFFTKKYRLTVNQMPQMSPDSYSYNYPNSGYDSGYSGGKFNDSNASVSSVKMLENTGVEITYIVEMPGEIIKAEQAEKISGNTAEFNIFDAMINKKPIVVESEEVNILGVGFVASAILLMVIILFFVVSKVTMEGGHEG